MDDRRQFSIGEFDLVDDAVTAGEEPPLYAWSPRAGSPWSTMSVSVWRCDQKRFERVENAAASYSLATGSRTPWRRL